MDYTEPLEFPDYSERTTETLREQIAARAGVPLGKLSGLRRDAAIAVLDQFEDLRSRVPLTSREWLSYRGVGESSLEALRKIGWVSAEAEFPGLDPKSAGLLRNMGFNNRGEVLAALKSGRLTPQGLAGAEGVKKVRGYGPGTAASILLWAHVENAAPAAPASLIQDLPRARRAARIAVLEDAARYIRKEWSGDDTGSEADRVAAYLLNQAEKLKVIHSTDED